MAPTPEIAAAVHAAITSVHYRMVPWSTGRGYLNFAEERKSGDVLFGVDSARLRESKRPTTRATSSAPTNQSR